MEHLILHGLYTVKSQYFEDFKRTYWMDNKNERRPYYYLIKDKDGIAWVVPLSSQVENYAKKIEREEAKRGKGNCIYYHIAPVASRLNAFLIGDMFPISEEYIKAPFTIGANHYISRNKSLNAAIYSKAMRFLKLIVQGTIHSRNDIMGIKQELIQARGESVNGFINRAIDSQMERDGAAPGGAEGPEEMEKET